MPPLASRPGDPAGTIRRALPLVGLVLVASACSGAVEVDSTNPGKVERTACETLLESLPSTLEGAEEREIDPEDALARAWGDPATVVTCGVSMPPEFTDYSACEEVNGVGWFIDPESASDPDADLTMTTIGIVPALRIDLPAEERPPAGVLIEVSNAAKAHLDQVKTCV